VPERWLPIPEWPAYEVSDYGRVRSYLKNVKHEGARGGFHRIICDKPQRILKQSTRLRYPYVILRDGSRNWTVKIHALVLLAFIGPRPDGLICCHNDGDPTNNRLDNLRWDTPSSNVQDSIQHGTYKNGGGLARRKFSTREIVQIRRQRADGSTYKDLGERWGIGAMPIFRICVGESYKDCPGPITPRRTGYHADRPGSFVTAQIPEE